MFIFDLISPFRQSEGLNKTQLTYCLALFKGAVNQGTINSFLDDWEVKAVYTKFKDGGINK